MLWVKKAAAPAAPEPAARPEPAPAPILERLRREAEAAAQAVWPLRDELSREQAQARAAQREVERWEAADRAAATLDEVEGARQQAEAARRQYEALLQVA